MIEGLKPYAGAAKPQAMTRTSATNIPWLTAIPEHWTVVRAKGLFTARTERARPDDEQLSATQAYGVIPQKEFERRVGRKVVQITQHLEKRAHVEPDDFVISMRSFQGGLERAWARGCIRSSYVVLKPSPKTQVAYFAHLFKSLDYIRALQATGNFIRDGQDLNFHNFCLVDLPLPPLDEQADIAKCLNYANRKIDGFIRAKKRELSLITEMLLTVAEQSLIKSDAQVMRLSTAAELVYRPIERRAVETYTKIGLFNRGRGIFHKPPLCGAELGDSEFFWIKEGDLVISGQFAWEGAVALAREKDQGCVASHRYPILRGRERLISSSSLLAILRTKLGGMLMDLHSRGAAGRNRPLNINSLLKEKVPIPSLSSQAQISGLLEQEYSAAQTIARSIRLVDEYRIRLTADIVTGKLDVREAAAKLPALPAEESTTNEPLEELETEELDE